MQLRTRSILGSYHNVPDEWLKQLPPRAVVIDDNEGAHVIPETKQTLRDFDIDAQAADQVNAVHEAAAKREAAGRRPRN